MGKSTGFKEFSRAVEPYIPSKERVLDFKEIYTDHNDEKLGVQAARCMDCLLYTSPSPRDRTRSRMPSSA